MGKRSNFERMERDFYPTPKKAVEPLLPFLQGKIRYAEPCCGAGDLIQHLNSIEEDIECWWASDIEIHPDMEGIAEPADALKLTKNDFAGCNYIITNPPWNVGDLHKMILHFQSLLPTWLLFYSDWMFTKQAKPFLPQCEKIVSVGRVKWIPDSKHTGKDNCAWYLFNKEHNDGPRFYNI